MKRVLLVQEYIPQYRVPLFRALKEALASIEIELTLATGSPPAAQAQRNDQGTLPNALTRKLRNFKFLGINFKSLVSFKDLKKYDAVVLPLAASFLDNYKALFASGTKVGLWGHVGSFIAVENRLDKFVETLLMRRADRIFAYTDQGRKTAIDRKIDPNKIDVLHNTISTDYLSKALRMDRSQSKSGGPFFLVLGGLDSSKRIDFLVSALKTLASRKVEIKVEVVGSGAEAYKFEPLIKAKLVKMHGFDSDLLKATKLVGCKAILNPGRIGLLAIDALAAKKPILTTDWSFHAPEFEYLTLGKSVLISNNSVESYADLIQEFLESDHAPTDDEWDYPKLDEMVRIFAGGIAKLTYS